MGFVDIVTDLSNVSDEELLAGLNEPASFEEIYRRHVGKVTSFAARRCSTPNEVPDLVAAVWLEVIASAGAFDARKGRALPWILGVAANLTASHERRRAREREAITRLGAQPRLDREEIAELERHLDAMEPARRALTELERLPLGERLVAELVMIEGLEPRDAARSLGIRPATARMRLMRARAKLQDSLARFRPMTDEPLPASEV